MRNAKHSSPPVPRVDGNLVRPAWPDSDETAREETFRRLSDLVAERDAVPEDVLVSARLSFELRSIDDELAALVYDSMIDDDLLASVRSGGVTGRQLTFASRGLVLEVEVGGSSSREVTGQVVPSQPAEIELRHRGGSTPVVTDELGYFQIPVLPEGPVSFRCRPAREGSESVATSWVML